MTFSQEQRPDKDNYLYKEIKKMKKESFNILLCALIVAGWLGLLFVDVLVITLFSNELAAFLVVGWLLVSMMVIGD